MKKALLIALLLCCSAGFGQGLAFGGGRVFLSYERLANVLLNSSGLPVSVFVVPMELDGRSAINSVGSYVSDGLLWRTSEFVSPAETSALFDRTGLAYTNNLSQDAMLVFYNSPPITSEAFTVGWWMRVDEIGSITTTLNDGFNVYLRNANGINYLRVGLVYTFPDTSTGTLNLKMNVRYSYSSIGLFDGYDTATHTVNMGEWHHFAISRHASGPNTFMFFFLDGKRIDYLVNRTATSGTISFAQHLWMGIFGFTTPIENYTTVKISVDEFFYTPGLLWSDVNNTPPQKMTVTESGKITITEAP